MIEFAYHNGRRRKMNRVYGDILAKLGHGKIVEPSDGRYHTAALTPEVDVEETQGDISPRTGKPKRQYRRRDLRAED
jgi:hypothetical protein